MIIMKSEIISRMLTKRYITLLFIFLYTVIALPHEAKSKITSSPTLEQIEIANSTKVIEELPPEIFSFRGVEALNSSVKIELKNDKVDLSAVIQSLNRVTQSHYRNHKNIEKTLNAVFKRVKHLCAKSKNKDSCQDNSKQELINSYENIEEEMSKNILYPRWYEKNKQDFKKALNFLNANCAANCKKQAIANSIIRDSDAEYSQLYDKIKNKDKDCQKDILQTVVKNYSWHGFPKKCLEKENKNHPVCDDMLKFIDTTKNRFIELVQLIHGEDTLTTTEALSVCLECVSSKHKNKFRTSLT